MAHLNGVRRIIYQEYNDGAGRTSASAAGQSRNRACAEGDSNLRIRQAAVDRGWRAGGEGPPGAARC